MTTKAADAVGDAVKNKWKIILYQWGYTGNEKLILLKKFWILLSVGVHRNEKRSVISLFVSTTHEISSIVFYVYMNIETRKILLVFNYLVSEVEKNHYYQLCQHIRRCMFILVSLSILSPIA